MWSKLLLCRSRQSKKIPQTQASKSLAAFRIALPRIALRHSQSRRATSCATPGYLVASFGWSYSPKPEAAPNLAELGALLLPIRCGREENRRAHRAQSFIWPRTARRTGLFIIAAAGQKCNGKRRFSIKMPAAAVNQNPSQSNPAARPHPGSDTWQRGLRRTPGTVLQPPHQAPLRSPAPQGFP